MPLLVPKSGRISVAPFLASLPKRDPSRPFPPIGALLRLPESSLHPRRPEGPGSGLTSEDEKQSVQVWFPEQPYVHLNTCIECFGSSPQTVYSKLSLICGST